MSNSVSQSLALLSNKGEAIFENSRKSSFSLLSQSSSRSRLGTSSHDSCECPRYHTSRGFPSSLSACFTSARKSFQAFMHCLFGLLVLLFCFGYQLPWIGCNGTRKQCLRIYTCQRAAKIFPASVDASISIMLIRYLYIISPTFLVMAGSEPSALGVKIPCAKMCLNDFARYIVQTSCPLVSFCRFFFTAPLSSFFSIKLKNCGFLK